MCTCRAWTVRASGSSRRCPHPRPLSGHRAQHGQRARGGERRLGVPRLRFLVGRGRSPSAVQACQTQRRARGRVVALPGIHCARSRRCVRGGRRGQSPLGPIHQAPPYLGGPGFVDRAGRVLHGARRLDADGQVGLEELAPQGAQQLAVDPARILESHLELRGMDVHVDHLRRRLDAQEGDGKAAGHQQAAIGLAEGVLQRSVADVAAIEQQVLHAVVAAAVAGMAHVAGQPDRAAGAFDPDQGPRRLLAEQPADPLQPALRAGQLQQRPLLVAQGEVHLGQGQGDAREGLAHVAQLGLRRAEELAADRRVEEQVGNLDRGAHRAAAGDDRRALTAGDLDLRPGRGVGRAAAQRHPAHLGDRGQRLAAEAQRGDAEQVVRLGELARGVAGHGQRQLVGRDPAAVVGHADQLDAAGLDRHVDPRGPGVDGVLQQLLDHARRPLDHLAGGDLVDQALRKNVDRHGGIRDEG